MTGIPPKFRRVWAMPNHCTFDVPAIGDLVRRHLVGVSVDPFARDNRWATHTNDLNPATAAEHHMEAADFLNMLADQGIRADVVLFDPPYSPRQIKDCYAAAGLPTSKQATQNARLYADCRRAIRRVVKPGGRVLSFGWNSAGMGKGFTVEEILLVNHGAAHNDTICTVEVAADHFPDAGKMITAAPEQTPAGVLGNAGEGILGKVPMDADQGEQEAAPQTAIQGKPEDGNHAAGVLPVQAQSCGAVCRAGQQDGIACADGECDRENGTRPSGVDSSRGGEQ